MLHVTSSSYNSTSMSAKLSSTPKLHVVEDSGEVIHKEQLLEAHDDANNGLSLMSHEVQSDGTITDVKGQL